MYRLLAGSGEVRERRDQLQHPHYVKARAPGHRPPKQVWSWDITKLKGPAKLVYFYLYVIVDIFSRYVVGWMVAEAENAGLAERLIEQSCSKQGIARTSSRSTRPRLADDQQRRSHSSWPSSGSTRATADRMSPTTTFFRGVVQDGQVSPRDA